MAGASLFSLLDDITALLDDVAVMTKVAARKTAGVVGDDLALNVNQVQGVVAAREWPVVWAVAKGSLVNKLILVPAALLLSVFAAFLVKPLLMAGGAFLCFEGVEKILHAREPKPHMDEPIDREDERTKVRGAIRTDFILSAEIIVIALGTLAADTDLVRRLVVLAVIGIGMTVGVYGFVAAIVKIDDVGLALVAHRDEGAIGDVARGTGRALIASAPWLMRFLSVAGTLAMFLVGGELLLHNLPNLHPPEGWLGTGASLLAGLLTGAVVVGLVKAVKTIVRAVRA